MHTQSSLVSVFLVMMLSTSQQVVAAQPTKALVCSDVLVSGEAICSRPMPIAEAFSFRAELEETHRMGGGETTYTTTPYLVFDTDPRYTDLLKRTFRN